VTGIANASFIPKAPCANYITLWDGMVLLIITVQHKNAHKFIKLEPVSL